MSRIIALSFKSELAQDGNITQSRQGASPESTLSTLSSSPPSRPRPRRTPVLTLETAPAHMTMPATDVEDPERGVEQSSTIREGTTTAGSNSPSSLQDSHYALIGNTFHWYRTLAPARVLVIKRLGDETNDHFLSVVSFLQRVANVEIYVEDSCRDLITSMCCSSTYQIKTIDTQHIALPEVWTTLQSIHLVITLGGDGTLLYAASLFQSRNTFCPPILPFALGSLGFLTPISFDLYKSAISRVLCLGRSRSATVEIAENLERLELSKRRVATTINEESTPTSTTTLPDDNDSSAIDQAFLDMDREIEQDSIVTPMVAKKHSAVGDKNDFFDKNEPVFVTKRTRLFVTVDRNAEPGTNASLGSLNGGSTCKPQGSLSKNKRFVLNEVVIDRGPSHGMIHLELFINDMLIADIIGDGLIISTPTGSTAYNLSAGGSLVHPSTVAVLVTPICGHSLSVRPLVIPPGLKLDIKVADDTRTDPWISFDGRDAHCLKKTHHVSIMIPEKVEEKSGFIVPCICLRDPVDDWFGSLSSCLKWNIDRDRTMGKI